jgi:hypothetical protein
MNLWRVVASWTGMAERRRVCGWLAGKRESDLTPWPKKSRRGRETNFFPWCWGLQHGLAATRQESCDGSEFLGRNHEFP